VGQSNRYWNASDQASIQQSGVDADWGRPGVPYSSVAVGCLNFAFEVFYTAKTNILQCEDASQRAGMLSKLHDAATNGWGRGVQDLDDAFEHLIANGGRWTDSHTSNYYGGPGKIFKPANMILEAPTAAVNFLDSVDDKMKSLREAIAQFSSQAQQVTQAQQANDWARASTALNGIKDYGGRVKYLLWWAPRARMVVERANSFAGILGEFTSALDLYQRGLQAGLPREVSASLVALRTAMQFVPVLGSMYGQIVDGIPGLVEWFRNLNEEYFRRIDRATRG
jgi:hypothetical protein